jgi:hypothetical protein
MHPALGQICAGTLPDYAGRPASLASQARQRPAPAAPVATGFAIGAGCTASQ